MKASEIVKAACEKTGLGPFPDASYREGLEFLIQQINQCAAVTEKSLQVMEREMVSALCNRFRVEDYLLHHPEVLEEKIVRPVFVFGIPRTGTTFTNHLLGPDPNRR